MTAEFIKPAWLDELIIQPDPRLTKDVEPFIVLDIGSALGPDGWVTQKVFLLTDGTLLTSDQAADLRDWLTARLTLLEGAHDD